jgi:transposase-like protein
MKKISYRGYRFPPEIIQQAIWLYLRFKAKAYAELAACPTSDYVARTVR